MTDTSAPRRRTRRRRRRVVGPDRRVAAARRSTGRRAAVGGGPQIDAACRSLGFFRVIGHGVDPNLLERPRSRGTRVLRAARRRCQGAVRDGARRAGVARLVPGAGRAHVGSARPQGGRVRRPRAPSRPSAGARTARRCTAPTSSRPASSARRSSTWLAAVRHVADARHARHRRRAGTAAPTGSSSTSPAIRPCCSGSSTTRRCPTTPTPTSGASASTPTTGLLTLLAQDERGGLQVRTPDGRWLDVPAEPGVLVCNIGDMLDRLTEGRYRSTPHRVRNISGQSRLSFPYFFDPSWDAVVTPLPLDGSPPADDADRRWDGTQRARLGRAATATTSPPRSPRCSPSCSPAVTSDGG